MKRKEADGWLNLKKILFEPWWKEVWKIVTRIIECGRQKKQQDMRDKSRKKKKKIKHNFPQIT